ncbi:mitochondrial translation release factor in rescue [Venturia canescens]|uniref:mitochondrial translation release factor in rescue n=1 Tax=Venturia canescens TaxID=32260 RepID=UPI001C9D2E34|nr:mitochondrial translation release factor in rescue [Venturia canescens]
MNSKLDYSKVPKLDEKDLVEQFVRGDGPGGQATAKTNNAVVLKHVPTGIVVKCHETRSLWDNKQKAREILITKLDNMMNGKDSVENQKRRLLAKKSASMLRKKEKMAALKAAFKEREGID